MQALNLPTYQFRTKNEKGKTLIFDALRKKWLALTPEEWVRQNFNRFLIENCAYPPNSIGVEVGLTINGRPLRVDGVVYNKYGTIKMLLEFKAPKVPVNEKVFAQAADYNTQLGAPFVIVSNGLNHFCAKVDKENIQLLEAIPAYTEL